MDLTQGDSDVSAIEADLGIALQSTVHCIRATPLPKEDYIIPRRQKFGQIWNEDVRSAKPDL